MVGFLTNKGVARSGFAGSVTTCKVVSQPPYQSQLRVTPFLLRGTAAQGDLMTTTLQAAGKSRAKSGRKKRVESIVFETLQPNRNVIEIWCPNAHTDDTHREPMLSVTPDFRMTSGYFYVHCPHCSDEFFIRPKGASPCLYGDLLTAVIPGRIG